MRALPFVALALALVVAAPAAMAHGTDDFTVNMSFNTAFTTLSMNMQMQMTGDDAQGVRGGMDAMGNSDGTVTQAEVDAFVAFFQAQPEAQPDEGLDSENMTLDGKGATSVSTASFAFTGATGSVTSTSAITMTMSMSIMFTPGSGPNHVLALKGDGESSGDEAHGTLKFTAPAGYTMSVSGIAGHQLSSDKRTMTLHADTAPGSGTITFAPAGSASSPMPVAPFVALTLLAVASVARGLVGRRA